MNKTIKKILSLILITTLTATTLSFFGTVNTVYVFADPIEPVGEVVVDQERLGDAVSEYAEALESVSVAPVKSSGIVQSLVRFGTIAGSVASAVHAGVVFLQMIGVIKDPTAVELSKIMDTVTNIENQLYDIDNKLDKVAEQLYNLAAADEERDRQTQARSLLQNWLHFETSYVDPLKSYVSEYEQIIREAINDWWLEGTHEGTWVLYTSLNNEIVPTYYTASYDAELPETATNGEPVLPEYSFGLPSEYMPDTALIGFDINTYSETFCELVKPKIIEAANAGKLDASEEFYTNWKTLDDEGKTEKAASYASDLLDSLTLRIAKAAMTQKENDMWVTHVKNAYNLYCEHIREKDSGLDALINVEYMTHGFEGEAKDEITQIGDSMIATCGYYGSFVQSIMEQDDLQPIVELQAIQNTWADTILFLKSKKEAALTGYDNFCYITHTNVDCDELTMASDMTCTWKFASTPTKLHTYKGFSSTEWELTDSEGNRAEDLPLVPNTSTLVLYHTVQGQQTDGELFSAYLNRNGVSVDADFTGRFMTNYQGSKVFSLDDGVKMQAYSAWNSNGHGVFSDNDYYNINTGNKNINNEYIILHDKVIGDYLNSKTGTLSTDQLLSARAAYFEGHKGWSNDQGWFFYSGDDWTIKKDVDNDTATAHVYTKYHALTSTGVAVNSAHTDSNQPILYANNLSDGLNDAAAPVISENSPLLAFGRISLFREKEQEKTPEPYSTAAWDDFYQENILLVSEDDENYLEYLVKMIDHAADEYESQDHIRALTQAEKEELAKAVFQKDSGLCEELRANTSLDVLDVFGINGDEEKELALAKAVLPVSYLDQKGDPKITAENMDTCAFYEAGVMLDIETINNEACALLKPAFYVRPELVIWDPVLEEFSVFLIPKEVIKELGLTMNVRLSAVSAQTKDTVAIEHYDSVIEMNLDKTTVEQILGSGTDQFVAFTDSECSIFAFDQTSMVPLHQWEKTVSPATCTKKGKITYTCRICGEIKTESIPAAGHKIQTVKAKAATIKATGIKAHYRCTVCGKLFSDKKGTKEITKASVTIPKLIDISKASVTGISAKTYTGKALTPVPTVKMGTKKLVKGTDFTLSYKNNINAGTATVIIKGKGKYGSTLNKTFKINQASNSLTKVTPSSRTIALKNVKKKAQAFQLQANDKFKAKITFSMYSKTEAKTKKWITVSKAGKVTVKKGTPKGTYTLKVKVSAEGTKNYKAAAITKSIKITVK